MIIAMEFTKDLYYVEIELNDEASSKSSKITGKWRSNSHVEAHMHMDKGQTILFLGKKAHLHRALFRTSGTFFQAALWEKIADFVWFVGLSWVIFATDLLKSIKIRGDSVVKFSKTPNINFCFF